MMASGTDHFSPAQVPLVFVEQTEQVKKAPPPETGGVLISRGVLGVLSVLLLGAAIAGTGGFYVMWQNAKKATSEVQAKFDLTQKTIKTLTDEKAALSAERDKALLAVVPYGEIQRLQAATAAERKKIGDLLQVPSKVDYWKFHKAVDLQDPPVREPAELALKNKLDALQKLSADIGIWTAPTSAPPVVAGTIRPATPSIPH